MVCQLNASWDIPFLLDKHLGTYKQTMQTAVGAFRGEYSDGIDASPSMVANAGKSNHPAISSLNCPPFIAVELCREHLGVHPCDKRRSISECRPLFPVIDFSLASELSKRFHIEHEEDVLWEPDVREKDEEVAIRGREFLNWLWTRKEKEIAIVSHSRFLYHTLNAFGKDCHPSIKSEMCWHFANCELRSMVLVDKSMIGSNTSTTDFTGMVPNGLDLPSDVAEEKDQ
ncbi:hypothetical protein SAY87_004964 [Trapa incisa]|uniref:Phosphoglycerate mutase-like protein 1 n=1 Tax=Trapa incisa TaxID=236973 RepID=A0AAN7JQ00_9MYRT|nr:hypothetical protein SAY87_004964 [Trapa incisa]